MDRNIAYYKHTLAADKWDDQNVPAQERPASTIIPKTALFPLPDQLH